MTAEDAKAYLAENDIPQLMESLITGLMYHRPSDPLMFLEECLTKAKDMGLDKIKWNSFLEERKTTDGKELPEKTHPQIIVLMGPPGSGKNIQLQKLGDKYEDFVCITVGNLIRNKCEQNRGDDKWDAVNDSMNKGDFVDQITVRRLLMHEMESKVSNYYIIDGIPRSVQQADEMGRFIGRINIVFLLDCSEEYCRQQLLRNREIQSRGDDENEAIEQRLLLFKEVTLPMLKRYDDMGLLHYINGEKDEDEVFDEICKIIDITLPPQASSSSPSLQF